MDIAERAKIEAAYWSCNGRNQGQIVSHLDPQLPGRGEGNGGIAEALDITATRDGSDGTWSVYVGAQAVFGGGREDIMPDPVDVIERLIAGVEILNAEEFRGVSLDCLLELGPRGGVHRHWRAAERREGPGRLVSTWSHSRTDAAAR